MEFWYEDKVVEMSKKDGLFEMESWYHDKVVEMSKLPQHTSSSFNQFTALGTEIDVLGKVLVN